MKTNTPRTNKETPPANVGGTVFVRKANGRKLHFVCGGPSFDEAQRCVIERNGYIALWQAHGDTRMFYVFPDKE